MKTALWWSVGAALGLITGCSSSSPRDNTVDAGAKPPTTMDSSYSSDFAGDSVQQIAPPQRGYLPPMELAYDQLPQAVQDTVRRQAGNVPVARIVRETRRGQTVYKVELKREDGSLFHGTLIVAVGGALLKESHISEASGAATPPARLPSEGNPIERVPNGTNPATTTKP